MRTPGLGSSRRNRQRVVRERYYRGMVQRMTKPTGEVLKFMLETTEARHYGMEITQATGIRAGTLYPMLVRLEQVGWVESEWEEIDPVAAGRPARRYYHLTAQGRIEASERLDKQLRTTGQGLAEA